MPIIHNDFSRMNENYYKLYCHRYMMPQSHFGLPEVDNFLNAMHLIFITISLKIGLRTITIL